MVIGDSEATGTATKIAAAAASRVTPVGTLRINGHRFIENLGRAALAFASLA